MSIPLDSRGLCYIQGQNQKNDGTLQTYPTALIGSLSADTFPSPVGSQYIEIDGSKLDFHTGNATVAGLDYDARILVSGVTAVSGGSDMSIYSKNFNLNLSGAILLNGDTGTAGEVLTSSGAGAPYWGAGGGGPGVTPSLFEVLTENPSAGNLEITNCPKISNAGLFEIEGVGIDLSTSGQSLYVGGVPGTAGQVLSSGGAGPPIWIDNAGVTPTLFEVLTADPSAGGLEITECLAITNINGPFEMGGVGVNIGTAGSTLSINNDVGAIDEYLQSKGPGFPPIWAPVVGTVPLGDISAPLGLNIDCSNGLAFCNILAGPVVLGNLVANSYLEILPNDPSLDLEFHSANGCLDGDALLTIYPGLSAQPNTGSMVLTAAGLTVDLFTSNNTATVFELSTNKIIATNVGDVISVGPADGHGLLVDAVSAGQMNLTLQSGQGDCKLVSIDRGPYGPNTSEMVLESGSVRFTSSQTITVDNNSTAYPQFEATPYNCLYMKAWADNADSVLIFPYPPVQGWRFNCINPNANHGIELRTVDVVPGVDNNGFRAYGNGGTFVQNIIRCNENEILTVWSATSEVGMVYYVIKTTP